MEGIIRNFGVALAACSTLALAAVPASAEEADDTVSSQEQTEAAQLASGIADIVVTGRKRARSETLQSVPISMTALSAEQLSTPVVNNLIDIGRLTPNASLQSSTYRGVR
jgi:iron complex outermembrane receptor protein